MAEPSEEKVELRSVGICIGDPFPFEFFVLSSSCPLPRVTPNHSLECCSLREGERIPHLPSPLGASSKFHCEETIVSPPPSPQVFALRLICWLPFLRSTDSPLGPTFHRMFSHPPEAALRAFSPTDRLQKQFSLSISCRNLVFDPLPSFPLSTHQMSR